MKHQTKVLLKSFLIIFIGSVIFLFGIGVGSVGSTELEEEVAQAQECPECQECPEAPEPKIVEKEVEKIVYKDNPETLQKLEDHKDHACVFAYIIPSLADLADASADLLGQPRVPEMREYKSLSQNYYYSYCE